MEGPGVQQDLQDRVGLGVQDFPVDRPFLVDQSFLGVLGVHDILLVPVGHGDDEKKGVFQATLAA